MTRVSTLRHFAQSGSRRPPRLYYAGNLAAQQCILRALFRQRAAQPAFRACQNHAAPGLYTYDYHTTSMLKQQTAKIRRICAEVVVPDGRPSPSSLQALSGD